MKLSMIALALCFTLAPFAAHATARHHEAFYRVEQTERHAIPKMATAFVPAVRRDDDSDGLSRNHEDCNRGCIDSN